jgi:hypothetical protein
MDAQLAILRKYYQYEVGSSSSPLLLRPPNTRLMRIPGGRNPTLPMAETVRKRLRMTVKTVKTNKSKSKRDVWRKPRPLSVLRWVSISYYVDLMLKQLYSRSRGAFTEFRKKGGVGVDTDGQDFRNIERTARLEKPRVDVDRIAEL